VDPHAQRDRLRDPRAWEDTDLLKKRLDEAEAEQLTPPLAVALAMRLGSRGVDLERWATAVRLLAAAQRRPPAGFWLDFTTGRVLEQGGQRDAAAGYYRVALALRPETTRAWFNLALAFEAAGQRDEAIAHYRMAVASDPRDTQVRYNL